MATKSTTYGTIPTSTPSTDTSPLPFLSGAKSRFAASLATRRPWNHLFNLHSFSLPRPISTAYPRVVANLSYFSMNYIIILLLILFLSLLWHPISLIVFVLMMCAWLFLYFLRDVPLVIVGREIGDGVVVIVLSVLTLGFLILTGVFMNVIIAVLVGVGLVLVHAMVRNTDDLDVGDGGVEDGGGGWYREAVGGGGQY